MAKYNYLELKTHDRDIVGVVREEGVRPMDDLSRNERNALTQNNAIYIYRNSRNGKVYIGQTVHFFTRHKQHYDGPEEKFNEAGFDSVIVLFSRHLNGSALNDVESQMITYFMADAQQRRAGAVGYENEVINRTGGNTVNDYIEKDLIATEVVLPFWEKVLYKKGWVETETLAELRTRALVKYSPIKVLTPEQSALIAEITAHPDKSYVINGDAGTGKTVLLTHLVASYLGANKNARIGVVVQPNWKRTAEEIFRIYGMNSTRLVVTTSTSLINNRDEFDVIIIDEAHKLSRRHTKQDNSFNAVYLIPKFADCQSHLEIIQRLGHQVILMYDVLQAIRPANITREMIGELTRSYEKRFLTTQFRIQPPSGKSYTSEDYINGIKYLLFKDTGLLESGFARFDPAFNRDIFRDHTRDAYFGYFTESPMHNLSDWLAEDANYNPEHINRLLSGMFCCDTVDKWRIAHGKDPTITHFHENGLNRRWNSTQDNWINSSDEDADEQIGSVFAVQGIDLNAVGVMIGPDITVNEEGKLEADPDHHNNTNNKFNADEMDDPCNRFEFTLFILNQYYVLLTRGIDAIRLGFWENDAFREYMERTLEITEAQ